ncbi:MAG: peptidylprolyl isomerase [Bdellovibrionota bacterium]
MYKKTSIVMSILTVAACSNSSINTASTSPTIATVNQSKITQENFRDRLLNKGGPAVVPDLSTITVDQKLKELDQVIEEELVLQDAVKLGLLEKSTRLRREIMREYFQYKLQGGIEQPTPEEVKEVFERQKEDLEKVRAAHILLSTKSEAEKVLKEYQENPNKDHFFALAKKYSKDSATQASGGDLKWFTRAEMVPAFSDAVFAMQETDRISSPVKTEFGYHLIYLIGDKRGFDQHKGAIRIALAKKNKARIRDEVMAELFKQANIDVDKQQVAKVNF